MESQTHNNTSLARAKKWRTAFITISILVVVLYILGGALVGASYNCSVSDGYFSYGCINLGEWNAGVAFLSLASIGFLLWVIVLVLRFTSWYRQPSQPVNYGTPAPAANHNTTTAAATSQPAAATTHNAEPKTGNNIAMQEVAPTRFCPNCEHEVSGNFCGNCGNRS